MKTVSLALGAILLAAVTMVVLPIHSPRRIRPRL